MKVLIIGPLPPPVHGNSFANKILYENLLKRKVDCNFINTESKIISSKQGTNFSFAKAFRFLKTYLYLYRIIFSSLVYITPGQTFFGVLKYSPFILTCILIRRPYIIHVHGNYLGYQYNSLKGIKKFVFKYLISNATIGIVLSKSLVNNFRNLLPIEKVHIVENFVEKELLSTPITKKADKLRILYLSNLMKEKGILEVLDALIELNRKKVDFHATMAGSIEETIKEEVFDKLKLLGGKVEYVGLIKNDTKREKLENANVFILPTYYQMEGQPISILEGMATGNIIITTSHAGIPDIVNESNGFIVDPKSSQAITECLEKVNVNLEFMVNKYSSINKKYSRSQFTEDKFIEKILSLMNTAAKS